MSRETLFKGLFSLDMTREEIEQKMDELALQYLQTRDTGIPYELYKLARELEKMEKKK